jgi:hypothetical protein
MSGFLPALVRPVAWLVLPALQFLYRVWLRTVPSALVEGFSVVNVSRVGDEIVLGRLRDALVLLKRSDLRAYARARRYLRRLILSHTGGRGEYWYGMGICVLDADYIVANDVELLAMAVVHESIHGRLDRLRVRTTSANVSRVEHLCSQAELHLANHFSDRERYVKIVEDALQSQWWSQARTAERSARRLRAAGWKKGQ